MNVNDAIVQLFEINQSIQEHARRALELRFHYDEWSLLRRMFTMQGIRYGLFSPFCFLISSFIILILVTGLHFNYILLPVEEVNYSYLENEEMTSMYSYLFFLAVTLTWNFFLFFLTIAFKCNFGDMVYTSQNKSADLNASDLIYFNPVVFCYIIYCYNSNYFKADLDILFWAVYSCFMYINFIFTVSLYKYSKIKINEITNTCLKENNTLIRNIRFSYLFLFAINFLLIFGLLTLFEELDFGFKYIFAFKGVFLIFKQFEFYFINEADYKYICWGASMKEENYMQNLSLKTKIQITNLFLVLHAIVVGLLVLIYSNSGLIYILPMCLVIISTVSNIFQVYSSYRRIKVFYEKLDLV